MAQIIRALGCVVIALVATAANSEIVGVWEGTENGLPSVELSVQIKDGKVNGSIAFYFQSREADGKWQLGDKYVVPLLSPRLEGRSLRFETIHHKCHDSAELGPNNKYQVDFVGVREARLHILKDQKSQNDQGFRLTRRL